jgi:hypothetical protein
MYHAFIYLNFNMLRMFLYNTIFRRRRRRRKKINVDVGNRFEYRLSEDFKDQRVATVSRNAVMHLRRSWQKWLQCPQVE